MPRSHKAPLWIAFSIYLVAATFYFYEFLLRVSPNVLSEELSLAFKMDAKDFGLFASIYYWSYAVLQVPAGALTDKYGPRRLITAAILVCAFSTILLASTQNFALASIARLFIGAGSALAFISCIKIVHIWFPTSWFPFMVGLTLALGTLGAAGGGTPLSIALDYIDWRSLTMYLGFIGLSLGILAWVLIRDKVKDRMDWFSNEFLTRAKDHATHAASTASEYESEVCLKKCLYHVVSNWQSWIIGIYAFLTTAPTDAFGGSWGVKYLIDSHNLTRDAASFASVTMTFVGMAVGSPLIGAIAGFFDNRKIPMIGASVIAAFTLTLIIYGPVLTPASASILFFLFGASGTYVLAYVVIRRVISSKYVATAVGFVNMVSIFGSAILTYFIGWMIDYVYSGQVNMLGEPIYTRLEYYYGLMLLPVFYILSAILVFLAVRDD